MAKYRFNAGIFFGDPLSPADTATEISVYNDSDDLLEPVIWSDIDGLSPISNPFNLVDLGKVTFCANEGSYTITATRAGETVTPWANELLGPTGGGGGAVVDFSDLGDVPGYSGNYNRSLKVNGAENALVIGEPDITVGTTAASYSLSLAIWNQFKTITGSGTVNITIPLDATLDLPIGYVHCVNPNEAFSGTATWVPESGSVNVESPAGGTLVTPAKGTSGAMKRGANDWFVFGQVEAV